MAGCTGRNGDGTDMDDHAALAITQTHELHTNTLRPADLRITHTTPHVTGGDVFVCLVADGDVPGSVGDRIAARDRELLDQIFQTRLLRDAQEPGGAWHAKYQRDIEVLTGEREVLRGAAGELVRVDGLRARLQRELAEAAEAAGPGADPLRPVAGFAGLVGASVLLLALWREWGVASFVVAVVLVGVAVWAMFGSVRWRHEMAEREDIARERLAGVSAEWDGLVSGGR